MPINIPTTAAFLGASALAGLMGISGTVPMEQARRHADEAAETTGRRAMIREDAPRGGHHARSAAKTKREAKQQRKAKKRAKAKQRKHKRRARQRERDRKDRDRQRADERLLKPDFSKHRSGNHRGMHGAHAARSTAASSHVEDPNRDHHRSRSLPSLPACRCCPDSIATTFAYIA